MIYATIETFHQIKYLQPSTIMNIYFVIHISFFVVLFMSVITIFSLFSF